MAILKFDAEKIEQDIIVQLKEDIKKDLRKKFDTIIQISNENPTITFIDTNEGFSVNIDNCSEELAARLEKILADGTV